MTRTRHRNDPDRLLTMPELADLLGFGGRLRCRKVQRLFRRLEKRDDARYLHRIGERTYGVRLSSVERALPWSPGTLTAIRVDLNEVGEELSTVKKRVNAHGARLNKLESWRTHAQKFLAATAELFDEA